MGGMLLQLTVSPTGDVTNVKELVSRIADGEFKKAVLAEASKWTFPEIITDSTTITCPILFVREGMDITTIVQWEKTLGQFSEKSAIAKPNAQVTQQSQAPEGSKRNEPPAKTATVSNKAKPEQTRKQNRYRECIKSSIPLRFGRNRTSHLSRSANSRQAPESPSLPRVATGSKCEGMIPVCLVSFARSLSHPSN